MNALKLCFALLLAVWLVPGMAGDLPPTDDDCAKILERWATDPSSVPQALVDTCREQLATAVPEEEEAELRPQITAVDPCAGPNAADSVLCWGPWSALAPAADAPDPRMTVAALSDPNFRPELADQYDPDVEEPPLPPEPPIELPLGSCPAGTPCGFATVVNGVTSSDGAEATTFERFELASDGTQYRVDPDGPDQIESVTGMTVRFDSDRPDGYDNVRATGSEGDEQSRIVARVIRNDDGSIDRAADVWTHGDRGTGQAKSGYFAWGHTTGQADLTSLNNGAVTMGFAGPMSVDNRTQASMTVNFGSQPTWAGTWTNPDYSFGAGGTISGADLISSPGQFTPNVQAGSFVQGALLGAAGRQALAHIIDVSLEERGRIRDVGLLREVAGPAPVVEVGP